MEWKGHIDNRYLLWTRMAFGTDRVRHGHGVLALLTVYTTNIRYSVITSTIFNDISSISARLVLSGPSHSTKNRCHVTNYAKRPSYLRERYPLYGVGTVTSLVTLFIRRWRYLVLDSPDRPLLVPVVTYPANGDGNTPDMLPRWLRNSRSLYTLLPDILTIHLPTRSHYGL